MTEGIVYLLELLPSLLMTGAGIQPRGERLPFLRRDFAGPENYLPLHGGL